MKRYILFTVLIFAFVVRCYSQTKNTDHIFNYQTFDNEIFKFTPVKREGVTDQKFNYAMRILSETKYATNGDPKQLNVTDFWNITSSFVDLKEPAINIETAFKKAINLDPKSVCSYIKLSGNSGLDKIIPGTFLPFYANCIESTATDNKTDVKQYAIDNKLNIELVSLIDSIDVNDQKFRTVIPFNVDKQKPLDLHNQFLIDSLYSIYKTYIGKSLVGKEYEDIMWLVIQHSNIKTMEKYLPSVSKAVDEKELDVVPLKMLIDRIYTIKYHYQIFGSQPNVPVADEKNKSAVMENYNIE